MKIDMVKFILNAKYRTSINQELRLKKLFAGITTKLNKLLAKEKHYGR